MASYLSCLFYSIYKQPYLTFFPKNQTFPKELFGVFENILYFCNQYK